MSKQNVIPLRSATLQSPVRGAYWRRWGLLWAIWGLGLGLRLALSQMDRVVWGDEPFYLWLGRNWVTGQGYSFTGHPDVHHGPLFPWLAGLLYLATSDLALASEILYTLFGSLLVWPVYALGLELYDRRVGLGAAALTAVFPALTAAILHWGSMTEPIYMFCVYLGLWAGALMARPLWRFGDSTSPQTQDSWWAYPLAGLAIGLAYLARPEAIGYFVLLGAFIIVLRLARRRLWSGRFWLLMLLFVLAFGLAFGPYAYYTRLNTGAWMVSEKVGVAYLTGIGLAHGDTAAFDRSTWGLDSTGLETFLFSSESDNVSMARLILADPETFITVLAMNVLRFGQVLVDSALLPALLLPLIVLGLFARGWTRERTLKELFLLISMGPVLAFVLFFIQARYIVPLIPVFILWTALGLRAFSDWLIGTCAAMGAPETATPASAPRRRAWFASARWQAALDIGPALLVIALLLAAQPRVIREVTSVGSVRPEHKLVGEYLAGIVGHDEVIMARYPAIAFHADARWVPTPNASWPEILRYAQHKGVRYFVIDERELRYRPQLQNLVTGDQAPAPLQRLYQITGDGERIVVYRLGD